MRREGEGGGKTFEKGGWREESDEGQERGGGQREGGKMGRGRKVGWSTDRG